MPRNSSGIYTLPSGNPVLPDTIIDVDWANPTMLDIGNALTLSLPRNGSAGMNGPLVLISNATSPLEAVPLQQLNSAIAAIPAKTASEVINVPAGGIAATNVQAALNELDAEKVTKTANTGSAVLPVGTTAERDAGTPTGYLRYNTTLTQFEGYGVGGWGKVGGGATGGGTDSVFYLNGQTVTVDYTIPTGQNAMSAGPITINSGITVTVGTGQEWSIV